MPDARPDSGQASFHVERADASTWLIIVVGEVDLANHEHFQAAVDLALQAAPSRLVFDLAEVRFMDSIALHILIKAAHSPAAVEIRNPSPATRRLIEITGLAAILTQAD